ncbi:MAG TPA: DMT family transporter [Acidimicrobiales bacterium]|nr:DMT family transporter [Acidimicrobiales bacterium]
MPESDHEGVPPAMAVSVLAGALGAIQPKVNAVLAARLDSPVLASLVNFAVACAFGGVLLGFRPGTRRHLRSIRAWPVPRWTFLAGLGGVLVVLSGAVSVETIGVAVFSVAFYAGQLTAGLLVDRLGIGAGGVRLIAPSRVWAAALALVAVAVSQLGRPVGDLAPGLVAVVLVAGAAASFQAVANGRIADALDDAAAPTAVNTTVGTAALLLITAALAVTGHVTAPTWPAEPWLYVGGALGVAIVLSIAIAAAAVGVLRATLTMLAAQLVAAMVVDAVVTGDPPTPGVVAGAGLILVAVLLLRR